MVGRRGLRQVALTTALPLVRDADFTGLRLFIYELPGSFHSDLFTEISSRAQDAGSDCDFMISPCTESKWLGSISQARQRGAEVVILRKLLAAPQFARTSDPAAADLFIVPYLIATDCLLGGFQRNCLATFSGESIFSHLEHYNYLTRFRHLFLATADMHSLPLQIQSQPLLVTRGAFWGNHLGHLVMPSAVAEAEYQPASTAGKSVGRDILFWLAQAPNNVVRYSIQQQLIAFDVTVPEQERNRKYGFGGRIVVHVAGRNDEAIFQIPSPARMVDELQRALFCPAPPAENPSAGTKRLLDIILAGCVPVVIAFRTVWGSGISWWRHDGPPVEGMLPFPWDIDWRSLVIEVSSQTLDGMDRFGFVKKVLSVPMEEIDAKRRYIQQVRDRLLYDLLGGMRDAFSQLMERLRVVLPTLAPAAWDLPRVSALVCDSTPLTSQARRLPKEFGEGVGLEKAWDHPYGEVTCLPAKLWNAVTSHWTKDALEHTTVPAAALERYFVNSQVRLRSSTIAVLYEASISDTSTEAMQFAVAESPFVSCRYDTFPAACHDNISAVEESQILATFCDDFLDFNQPPKAVCRLLPSLVPAEPLNRAQASARFEIVVQACGARGNLHSLAEKTEHPWTIASSRFNIQLSVFEVCGDQISLDPTLLYILALKYAQQRQSGDVPDVVLLASGVMGFQPPSAPIAVPRRSAIQSVLDMLMERAYEGHSLREAPLLALTARTSAEQHVCEAYGRLLSVWCPIDESLGRASPQAIIFSTSLLKGIDLPALEIAASGLLGDASPQMILDLIFVLLMGSATKAGAPILVKVEDD